MPNLTRETNAALNSDILLAILVKLQDQVRATMCFEQLFIDNSYAKFQVIFWGLREIHAGFLDNYFIFDIDPVEDKDIIPHFFSPALEQARVDRGYRFFI